MEDTPIWDPCQILQMRQCDYASKASSGNTPFSFCGVRHEVTKVGDKNKLIQGGEDFLKKTVNVSKRSVLNLIHPY